MNQINEFLLIIMGICSFCLAFMLGLLLYLTKKQYGAAFILLSVHILFINYELFFGKTAGELMTGLLILADLAVCACCGYSSVKSFVAGMIRKAMGGSGTMVPSPLPPAASETPAEPAPEPEEEENGNIQPLEELSEEDLMFFQRVEALMVNEKLFCEQDLSREDVATAIGTNRTYLARSIKCATGQTFSEYITSLRVNYAATLLTTTDEPLDSIGDQVGFRSKSTYYRAFGEAHGCTPSEYRRKQCSTPQ